MLHLQKGRYLARIAHSRNDLAAALALRSLCFAPSDMGPDTDPDTDPDTGAQTNTDTDAFDARCTHILIEDTRLATLVCCFRMLPLATGPDILHSYSAQFYDLTALTRFQGPLLEIGRFCLHPAQHDPDILRVAWGALTQWVDRTGVRLLFGCSSFPGCDAAPHIPAFRLLHSKHRAPLQWTPRPKAPEVFPFATAPNTPPDMPPNTAHNTLPCGPAALPPLLRTYLMMGGWVSDHAVFDRHLRTMHVFTGVEIASIPPARARLLRAVAG